MADKLTWDSVPPIDDTPQDTTKSARAKMTWDAAPVLDDAPQKDTSYGGAVKYGLEAASKGLSRTDDALIEAFKDHPWIQSFFQFDKGLTSKQAEVLHDDNYAPAKFDYRDPSSYGAAPRAAVEGLATNAPTLVAGVAGGPLGGAVAGLGQNYGNNLDARLANQPDGVMPTTGDRAAAAGSAILGGVLTSKLPIPGANAAVSGGVLPILGSAARSIGRDAAITGGTDLIQQGANSIGTARGLTVDPNETINSAALGGVTGAGLHGITAGSKAVSEGLQNRNADSTFKGIDPDAAQNLSDRLTRTGVDTSSPKGRFEAIRQTADMLKQDIDDIKGDGLQMTRGGAKFEVGPYLDSLEPYDRRAVNDSINTVQQGRKLSDSQKADVTAALGDSGQPSAAALLSLINQHDTLNTLTSKGKIDAKAGTFTSGFDTTKAGTMTNPVEAGKKLLGNSVAGALGGGAMGEMIGHAVENHVVPKMIGHGVSNVLAPLTGLLAARKALGSVMDLNGSKNQIDLFKRFVANNPGDGATSPMQLDLNQNIARQAMLEARLRQSMANPIPVAPEATPTAQPKFNPAPGPVETPAPASAPAAPLDPNFMAAIKAKAALDALKPNGGPEIDPMGIRAKALNAMKARMDQQQAGPTPGPDAPQPEAPQAAKPVGDFHTFQGIDYPVPDGVFRPGYVRSIETKQTLIDTAFQSALKNAKDPATQDALQEHWNDVKQSRNQDSARGFINKIWKDASPADRDMISKTFDDANFYKIWRKKSK